jgi:N-acetylglucosamine-6-phosphate deacetylase
VTRLWLRNALLVDPELRAPAPGGLLLEAGRIAARLPANAPAPHGAEAVDLGGALLAPGFLDVHHHGSAVFAGPDALASSIAGDARTLARHGVTGFLVTTVAWPAPQLGEFVERAAGAAAAPVAEGATPLGLHLEGPWISPRAAGAQPGSGIRPFVRAELEALLARAAGGIRMLTFAPELDDAPALADLLARHSVIGALGHSRCSASDADRVIERGARHVTHLFNAMGGVHHRELGLAGMALSDERLTCDLICDGAHVAPPIVRVAARALGDRLLAASDRIEPPPGADFGSGPLRDDGSAIRLPDGRLAGSRLTLDRAVANLRAYTGMGLCEAVAAASLRPARLLGLERERGTLRAGARADLAVLAPDGSVRETWIEGRKVWAAA